MPTTEFSSPIEQETEEEEDKRVIHSIEEEEKETIRRCISSLSQDEEHRSAALHRLRTIFDSYLENPTLLDPSFEEWVLLLTQFQKDGHDTVVKISHGLLFNSEMRYRLSALYTLSKVRGRKQLQRFLPHTANVVEPVWMTLQRSLQCSRSEDHEDVVDSRVQEPPLWESTYVLWIWMTACSYVPLNANLLVASQDDFLSLLMDTAEAAPPGPLQNVASACAASWLARPDASPQRQRFIDRTLQSFDVINHGRLQTLVTLLKVSSASRETLLQEQVLPLWDPICSWSHAQQNDWLLQKLLLKWWTRSACTFLPPIANRRSLHDRFHSHDDSTTSSTGFPADNTILRWLDPVEYALGRTLEALTHTSTLVRVAAAKGVGRITERLPALCFEDVLDALLRLLQREKADEDRDRTWHGACLALAELARRGLLQRLELVLPLLVQAVQYDPRRGARGAAVRDAACYTYWALVRAYPPEILQSYQYMQELREAVLLMSLFDREVNGRRAASAAFQESVGRQGARHVPHGLEIMTLANYYSLGNRSHAYLTIAVELAQHETLRRPILRHLYKNQLLHWDIQIRSLASQSLHRLTSLDPTIMSQIVMPKLLVQCLDEQDLCIRHGAVLGVAEIVRALGSTQPMPLPPPTLQTLVDLVPTMEQKRLYRGRGGEVMRSAVCRLVECMCIARVPLTVPEQVRLLDSIDANLPHPTESIQEHACYALHALLTFYFPIGATGPSERLKKRVLYKFMDRIQKDENPAVTRGYALAMGYLPDKLVGTDESILQIILDCLIQSSHHTSCVGSERDAATRKNSLLSLLRISRTLGWEGHARTFHNVGYHVVQCNQGIFAKLCSAFLIAMDDYNSDRRGDVGSWCRMVGIESLKEIMLVVSQCCATQAWISQSLWTTTVSALLKQCAEKLDSVRQCAGSALEQLLSAPYLTDLAHSADLIQTIHLPLTTSSLSSNEHSHRWFHELNCTYNMVLSVASIHDAYLEAIMRGIVTSIGGLSEDVRQAASSALLSWTKRAPSARREALGPLLLKLLKENDQSARLVQPTLKTIDMLITHGCLDTIIQSSRWTTQCLPLLERIALFHNSNVSCLGTLVDVTVSLLAARPGDPAEVTAALVFMCRRLAHPFPRVRSYTAQQFYVYLSLADDGRDNDKVEREDRNVAQALVSTTPWTQELPKQELHRVPTTIAAQLGVLKEFQQPLPQSQQQQVKV